MLEPIYFGHKETLLYGNYHPPQNNLPMDIGVVFCYPMGQEYVRSHRAMLQLAQTLAAVGFHVLRFDYYGCGDSLGESKEGNLDQWKADIASAVEELQAGTGVTRMCLIGLRLGASLAFQAIADSKIADFLILWDPVLSGQDYLDEQYAFHHHWLSGSFAKPNASSSQYLEILGFPLPISVKDQLQRLNLAKSNIPRCENILLVQTSAGTNSETLHEYLANRGAKCCYRYIPAPSIWVKQNSDVSKGLVPTKVLNEITAWITDTTS